MFPCCVPAEGTVTRGILLMIFTFAPKFPLWRGGTTCTSADKSFLQGKEESSMALSLVYMSPSICMDAYAWFTLCVQGPLRNTDRSLWVIETLNGGEWKQASSLFAIKYQVHTSITNYMISPAASLSLSLSIVLQPSWMHPRRWFGARGWFRSWKWCWPLATSWTRAREATPTASRSPVSTRSLTPSPA